MTTPSSTSRPHLLPNAWWSIAAVVLTGLIAAVRLVVTPQFYFADDTQTGSFGQWWELGDRLLSGGIPMLNPQAWASGNYFAEGQWGLLSPLTWIIALGARASEEPALYAAIVKIGFLMIMAGGVYLLARNFGANAPWAAVAGVLAPMGGFTVYMDAASWTTGLQNAALLPWVWWGLRRLVENGRSPLWYLVSSYLLISFGYVFGVLVLVVILLESLIRAWVTKNWTALWRTLAASVWGGLLTIAVYLPGVLTAPVTERAGFDIIQNHFLNADLSDLASAGAPAATASIGSWFGVTTNAPLVYVAWVLPFLPLFLPMARDAVRRCIPLFVVGGIALAVVLGPSDLGAIRWPVRFMPYVAIVVVVLIAVMATRAFPEKVTRRGVGLSFVLLTVTTGITWANTPNNWRAIFALAALQAVALLVLSFIARSPRVSWEPARRGAIGAAAVMLISAVIVVPQMRFFPETPLPKFAVPNSVERMQQVLADVPGDAIMVGDIYYDGEYEDSFDERLMGNLWYLSPADMSSPYTVLPFTTFASDLCSDLRGETCAEALETLWSEDPETGTTVADLMGVSTIVAMKKTYPSERSLAEMPEGWSIAEETERTWVIVRDETVPAAGGVTWTGEGTEISVAEQSDTSVTFTVDAVGSDSRVVLSRLAYPGYSVAGAVAVDPIRDWLLTVDVADVAPGDAVTVTFRPPGFPVMLLAFGLCAVMLVGWPILRLVQRRRASISA